MSKPTKYRKPTKDEEIAAWRKIAWGVNFARTMSEDPRQVEAIMKRLDAYVNSHATGNGTKPDPEINQSVWEAFWVEIAADAAAGQKK